MKFAIIFVIVALVVADLILVGITRVLLKRDKIRETNYRDIITEIVNNLFREENQKLAKKYSEELKLATWIEDVNSEELDTIKISSEIEKRAYALSLKKAEDAVSQAEDDLENVRRQISKEYKMSLEYTRVPKLLHQSNEAIAALTNQETIAERRVEALRSRLSDLIELQS